MKRWTCCACRVIAFGQQPPVKCTNCGGVEFAEALRG